MWSLVRPDSIAVLKEEKCRRVLARYFGLIAENRNAHFQIARKIPVKFSEKTDLPRLWKIHQEALPRFKRLKDQIDRGKNLRTLYPPQKSLLDLKVKIAHKILSHCHLCERRCGINRLQGEKGFCGSGKELTLSSYFEHMGEEPELVPSGTIFTMGCTLRCLHCQNYSISQWMERGEKISPETLGMIVDDLKKRKCRNANLVGGDPTCWLTSWLEAFQHVRSNIAVIWNSNSYYSKETAQLLKGFIDVYLLDFKYGPGSCAERISSAPRYWEATTRNHLEAKEWGEVIIRVLILPDHLECCLQPILKWIAINLGVETRVNVMFQYRPEWRADEIPELRRSLNSHERAQAVDIARSLGLTNFIT
ncbi:radical SAM protein [[Eubacterium] cellulosolvens]